MHGRIVYKKILDANGDLVEVPEHHLDGQVVTASQFLAAFPDQSLKGMANLMTPASKGWPMVSEAMEVHPSQVELARKLDRQRGAPPTDYNQQGQPILTSERHKRAFIKAHGCHDNNAYF